jgi:hypothetical protein
MSTITSNECKFDYYDSIKNIIDSRALLARQSEEYSKSEIDDIINTKCKDKQRTENTLDHLLDFCFDNDILILFKKLCRYYYQIDRVVTIQYVKDYKDIWDTEEE